MNTTWYRALERKALVELKAIGLEADVLAAAYQRIQVAPELMPAETQVYQYEMHQLAVEAQVLENSLLISGLMRAGWTTASGESMGVLAARLRAGGPALRRAARRNAVIVANPAVAAVRASARANLPKRGGLNEWVAGGRYTVSVLTGPRTAGVAIRGTKSGHDLRTIDRTGRVRHPVYGNRSAWATTQVQPGYFTRPLKAMHPVLRVAFLAAMREAADVAGF